MIVWALKGETDPDLDLAAIAEAELTDLGNQGGRVFVPLLALWSIVPTVCEVPASYFNQDYSVLDLYGNLSLSPLAYRVARDGVAYQLAESGSPRIFADRPSLTAFILEPTNLNDGSVTALTTVDLLYQSQTAIPWSSAATSPAPPSVASGALNHAIERVLLGNASADYAAQFSVGGVFDLAAAQSIPLVTLLPGLPVPTAFSASPEAMVLIDQALSDGYAVIVPLSPVTAKDRRLTGWWQVHLKTGETFDLMENGRGTTLGYADTVQVSVRATPAMRLLAVCTAAKVMIAAAWLIGIGIGAFYAGQASSGGITLGGESVALSPAEWAPAQPSVAARSATSRADISESGRPHRGVQILPPSWIGNGPSEQRKGFRPEIAGGPAGGGAGAAVVYFAC